MPELGPKRNIKDLLFDDAINGAKDIKKVEGKNKWIRIGTKDIRNKIKRGSELKFLDEGAEGVVWKSGEEKVLKSHESGGHNMKNIFYTHKILNILFPGSVKTVRAGVKDTKERNIWDHKNKEFAGTISDFIPGKSTKDTLSTDLKEIQKELRKYHLYIDLDLNGYGNVRMIKNKDVYVDDVYFYNIGDIGRVFLNDMELFLNSNDYSKEEREKVMLYANRIFFDVKANRENRVKK